MIVVYLKTIPEYRTSYRKKNEISLTQLKTAHISCAIFISSSVFYLIRPTPNVLVASIATISRRLDRHAICSTAASIFLVTVVRIWRKYSAISCQFLENLTAKKGLYNECRQRLTQSSLDINQRYRYDHLQQISRPSIHDLPDLHPNCPFLGCDVRLWPFENHADLKTKTLSFPPLDFAALQKGSYSVQTGR